MSFLESLLGAIIGSTVVAGLSVAVFKMRIAHSFDKKLAEFQSSIDKLGFVSTALYKNREEMIFDFDRCLRGLMGHWHCLSIQYPKTAKEFGFRWKEMLLYHEGIQSAYFKSRLVFPRELLELSEEIFKVVMDVHQAGHKVTHFHSVRLEYKYDEDVKQDIQNISVETFESARKNVLKQAAFVNNELVPKWEVAARQSLLEIETKI